MDSDDPPYLDDAPSFQSTAKRYDTFAYQATLRLIEQEHAVVWPEVEAKLADRPHAGAPRGIDPHHLTNARKLLTNDGTIEEIMGVARGGRAIAVYGLRDRRRRQTSFDRAAGRKRLLQTRYLGWSEASRDRPNLLGEGGEAIVRASLRLAMTSGAGIAIDGAVADVHMLLGSEVPGGPLDAAAQFVISDPGSDALEVVTALIEVKNLRSRIYPAADEIYQLLDKAAQLQSAHSSKGFVPVLACRRAHYLTFIMAKHVGAFVIEFDRPQNGWPQPLLPHWTAPPDSVMEVRQELGYLLIRTEEAIPHLTQQFQRVLPQQALAAARRWAQMGPVLAPHVRQLRNEHLSGVDRDDAMDQFYRAACDVTPPDKPWRHRTSSADWPEF